jgi:mono/diheme cytochrome c family protein
MHMRAGLLTWAVIGSLIGIGPRSWAADAPAASASGAQTYAQLCVQCHGRYGRGDGPLAANLTHRPPDFTDAGWLRGRSDADIAKGLADTSHGPMALANVLKPDVLLATIAYTRTLSVPGKHVSVAAGRDIYNATCWQCHGTKGDGKGPVVPFLGGAQPRDFTAATFVIDGREDEVAQFITVGAVQAAHGSRYMPEWASRLSPQQIRDTVEYLRTFKHPQQ